MAGFEVARAPDTVARKKGYMQEAQQRWGFRPTSTCRRSRTNVQLSPMVKARFLVSRVHRPRETFRPGCEGKQAPPLVGVCP